MKKYGNADGGVRNGADGQLTCNQEGWREKGCEVATKVMTQDDENDIVHDSMQNETTLNYQFT